MVGELTVIKLDEERNKNLPETNHQTYWICKCSCGREISAYAVALKDGRQKSCGDGVHMLGELSPNWQGGKTPENIRLRGTKQYRDWRKKVYEKDWFTCQCCGRNKGIIKNAHHIYNFSSNPQLRFDEKNGITLCEDCHYSSKIGSFHNLYGTVNNTPEQLEEYINNRRNKLGINIPFSMETYQNGDILKPGMINYDDPNDNYVDFTE